MNQPKRASVLRKMIASGCVAMPGAFNAYTARLIEAAGFEAVYVSGAGLANATAGVPDIGLLGLDEVALLCGYIADAVRIPVIADADTGWGGTSNAAKTVREFERAGLAGLHLEDQEFPKRCGHLAGKSVISADEMCERIRAAVDARVDRDFLIIARTDSRSVEGLDAAIERAHLYLEAGADAVFPEAMQTTTEFERFAKEVDAPLLANMTEFGKGPLLSVKQLTAMGYRMVIFPQTVFRVTSRCTENVLAELKREGTQAGLLDQMQTREELYKTLGYDPAVEIWRP